MLANRKVFALCTSRVQSPEILESVYAFVQEGQRRGYAVLVFNTGLDPIEHRQNIACKYCAYDLIPLQIVDALVIMNETLENPEVAADLVRMAHERRIPILSYDGNMDGAHSVFSYTHEAFDDLLEHIFGEHQCRQVDFLTGIRGNYGSECMVKAYRTALERHGLPFEEFRVEYGEYWEGPATAAVERLLTYDTPDAIVCANDEMAIAACAVLRRHGLRIPEDVIVTGNDGIVKERSHTPRLTTCVKDYALLASTFFDTAEMVMDGAEIDMEVAVPPVVQISESCGCCVTEQRDQNLAIRNLYYLLTTTILQESEEYRLIGTAFERKRPTVIDFLDVISSHIPEDSYLCLRDSLSPNISDNSLSTFAAPSELMSTVMQRRQEKKFEVIPRSQLIPDLEKILAKGHAVLVNSIYFQDEVYGYFAYYGKNWEEMTFKLPKFIHTAGNVIGSSFAYSRLQAANEKLMAARTRDSLTGMYNLAGVTKVLKERMRTEAHTDDRLGIIAVSLNKLRQINSMFGREEGDQALLSLASAINDTIDDSALAARVGGDEFVIAFFDRSVAAGTAPAIISVLEKRVRSYNEVSGKRYTLEITIGQASTPVSNNMPVESLLNEAISVKNAKQNAAEGEMHMELTSAETAQLEQVLKENLLTYYFQPIVSAHTGEIYAYEALMRTSNGIRLSPMMILDFASQSGRLYEIEWLTYNNVLRSIEQHADRLHDRKIFINSIPGHFLTDTDFGRLVDSYGIHLSRLVVEFTEQAETVGTELEAVKDRCASYNMEIAVDDYGTGYSNISNLLRYSPNYVKIDRSLISNIHEDPKKQHFVTNVIAFAHSNGFKALAEGVETADELRTVIRYGADLIQGNFTAMPDAQPLARVPDHIAALIQKYNANAGTHSMQKAYIPQPGEKSVSLTQLEAEHYTYLYISQDKLDIVGDFNQSTSIHIKIKDDLKTHLTIHNIHCSSEQQGPAITIGRGCDVTLEFDGDNRMDSGGILVPVSSVLHIVGRGNLSVRADEAKSFAIGNDPDFPCGEIHIDLAGCLNIISNGHQCVGIGAGMGKGQKISVYGTTLFVEMSGKNGVGVGVLDGECELEFIGCSADFSMRIAENLSIGALEGAPKIRCNTAVINAVSSGTTVGGIGSCRGGGEIDLRETSVTMEMMGQNLAAIGSGSKAPRIKIRECTLDLRVEGMNATDIGSADCDADLTIVDCNTKIRMQSGKAKHFAADPSHFIHTGGTDDSKINV